jgi:hypothetical protein
MAQHKSHPRFTQGRTKRKMILPILIFVILYICFSSYRRPEVDLSLSLKEGPGMIELVNEGLSHFKRPQTSKKFPELKFRRSIPNGNLSECVNTANESIPIPEPIPEIAPTFTETFENNPHLAAGGYFRSDSCKPIGTTAVIIPFRNREHHLKMFLAHTHPILQKQAIEVTIFQNFQKAQNFKNNFQFSI